MAARAAVVCSLPGTEKDLDHPPRGAACQRAAVAFDLAVGTSAKEAMHEIASKRYPAPGRGVPPEGQSLARASSWSTMTQKAAKHWGALLAQAGLKVALADSVREALRALDLYSPSVLVSDLMMPVEDGFTVIQTIREREEGSKGRLPAIAVTAIADPSICRHAVAAGFDACFLKPFAGPAVVNAVAQAVLQSPASR